MCHRCLHGLYGLRYYLPHTGIGTRRSCRSKATRGGGAGEKGEEAGALGPPPPPSHPRSLRTSAQMRWGEKGETGETGGRRGSGVDHHHYGSAVTCYRWKHFGLRSSYPRGSTCCSSFAYAGTQRGRGGESVRARAWERERERERGRERRVEERRQISAL